MLCKKCNAPGTIAIRKIYYFCDECFTANIIHKFRSCIGKNSKLSLKDKALICLSGDISSTVLLDLVMNGISLNSHKKLRISPTFVHLTGITSSDEITSTAIINQCKKYNVDVSIVNVRDLGPESNFTETSIEARHSKLIIPDLQQIINNVSLTTEVDFVSKIKQHLFYKAAKDLGCNLIFTAETNTKLSAKLLSNIVTGRGSQIENDIGFADLRDVDIKLLRPMREITEEELCNYIQIKQLGPVHNFNTLQYSKNTLQSLIKKFISDLQDNSPATISTICKTADKIGSGDNNTSNKNCKLCQSHLNSKPDKLIATDAITFSKMVSSGHYRPSNVINDLNDKPDNLVFPYIYEALCYSCSKNYYELRNTVIE